MMFLRVFHHSSQFLHFRVHWQELSLSCWLYVCKHIHVYTCVYIYIYTHTWFAESVHPFPALIIFLCLKIFSNAENVTHAFLFHLNPSNSFPISPVPFHLCCWFLCLLTRVWTGNRGQLYIEPGVFKLEIYFPATRLLCLLRLQLSHYFPTASQQFPSASSYNPFRASVQSGFHAFLDLFT